LGPNLDGRVGVLNHCGKPDAVHGNLEVGGRELLQEATSILDAIRFCVGKSEYRSEAPGHSGSVGCHLLQEWCQFTQGPASLVHADEMRTEEDGGVWLSAVGADLEGFGGQLFGPVRFSGNQRARGAIRGVAPTQHRLVKSLGQRRDDVEAAIHFIDIVGMGSNIRAPAAHNTRELCSVARATSTALRCAASRSLSRTGSLGNTVATGAKVRIHCNEAPLGRPIESRRTPEPERNGVDIVLERCCGFDVHKDTVVACVRAQGKEAIPLLPTIGDHFLVTSPS
jgi:hypothetical protein